MVLTVNVTVAMPLAFVVLVAVEKEPPFVLVHVTTIPDLLKAFGCPGDVTIAPLEYDDLFVVVPKDKGTAALVRLKY